jgi:hypothetical protein
MIGVRGIDRVFDSNVWHILGRLQHRVSRTGIIGSYEAQSILGFKSLSSIDMKSSGNRNRNHDVGSHILHRSTAVHRLRTPMYLCLQS